MAGIGSRFLRGGEIKPKPIIELFGHPFFWWAVESAVRVAPFSKLTFVVLLEHCKAFQMDLIIKRYYPKSSLIILNSVTSGSAETAMFGCEQIKDTKPVAFLDCDHAFTIVEDGNLNFNISNIYLYPTLCVFRSKNPSYSYVKYNEAGEISGAVEKIQVSEKAIAGLYFFPNVSLYKKYYKKYQKICPYSELYISGIYNLIIQSKLKVNLIELSQHISFGTPEELRSVQIKRQTPTWFKH